MNTLTKVLRSGAAIAGLLFALAAQATPLTVTLDAPFQISSSASGGVLTFYANLLNTDPTATLYLNGDDVNLQGTGLTLDDSGFWNNGPLSLAPGASSGLFALFSVTVDAGTPAGLYAGSFAILGGGAADSDALGQVNFNVNVVPEPSSVLLLGAGLCAGLATRARAKLRRG